LGISLAKPVLVDELCDRSTLGEVNIPSKSATANYVTKLEESSKVLRIGHGGPPYWIRTNAN